MSKFEYIAVLVSLVLGLGIANILTGLGRMINRRNEFPIDVVHFLWSIALFVVLVLNWWVFFKNSEVTEWTFEYFLSIIVWAVIFYLMTVVLFPTDKNLDQDYGKIFLQNRSWFLGLFIASNLMDIIVTALRGQLFSPPFYLPFVLHFVALGIIGLKTESRAYHVGFASYILFISLTWSFFVRLLLV
ncbi:hypothetical protein FLL45_12945 [Aliikangiella marina]|uniref:Uncharacterized protein n=1 Tax=Aliikangiella marina TaxID=1712262 RepID=A0A545T976_9GAMM|nr:hypothetical protein [Aliikangiella marina]TQV73770.1 hypothetical protein FLL45_12945 [Aliikangiella marina]